MCPRSRAVRVRAPWCSLPLVWWHLVLFYPFHRWLPEGPLPSGIWCLIWRLIISVPGMALRVAQVSATHWPQPRLLVKAEDGGTCILSSLGAGVLPRLWGALNLSFPRSQPCWAQGPNLLGRVRAAAEPHGGTSPPCTQPFLGLGVHHTGSLPYLLGL